MKKEVRERGGAVLTAAEWLEISGDPGFADLVDRSILSAEPAKGGRGWRIKAGAYVGRATLGRVDVEVTEKVPGAFEAMSKALAPRSFRYAHAATRVSVDDRPDVILATMLIAAARSYLSEGAEAEYREEELSGAYVTGRLDVRRTANLRARGIRHRVAFTRSTLEDDTPLNRSVYAALGVLSTSRASTEFGVKVATPARALRASFGESAKSSTLMSREQARKEAASQIGAAAFGRSPAAREVAVLASAVLEGAALTKEGGDRTIPRTWFVNLESLFELFIRKLAADALTAVAEVGSAASWPRGGQAPPLFPDWQGRYSSNPDLVIMTQQNLAIGDAKYKDYTGWPGASDLYQLVAHAAACRADRAALFYPSDGPWMVTSLGLAATGCRIWAFGLDMAHAEESMRRALQSMELLTETRTSDMA